MKRLILVCGANGVGKSTACRKLVETLDRSAYLDSDWCRAMNPFSFDPETIRIITSNIVALMTNYFRSSFIDSVIFQYGLHGPRRQMLDDILGELTQHGISYRFCPIILKCDLRENVERMRRDGRDEERIERAIRNTRHIYDALDYPFIDTTKLSVAQTVGRMLQVLTEYYAC